MTPTTAAQPSPALRTDAPPRSAAQRTIAVIGDAWTLRILRTVFRGKRRFSDFVRECSVSRSVLTDRLARLVEHAVLTRTVVDGRHPEYRLTERGLDLWTLFLAMWLWEKDWGIAQTSDTWATDLPRAQLVHTPCGHGMRPQLQCLHCHAQVQAYDTAALPQTGIARAGDAPEVASAFRRARAQPAGTNAAQQVKTLARVVGDRWNSAVVASAFRGVTSFSGFEQALQIGPTQLSDRLAELLQLGIVRTHSNGSRQEYKLSKAGIALYPVTLELVRWGNRWISPAEEHLRIQHLPCQHELAAAWHCGHCGEALTRASVRFS